MRYIFLSITFLGFALFISSCKQEGCTDPHAKNFSYEAIKDDGSCDYRGCTDRDALNYNENAIGDDGSCKYLGGVHFITHRNSVNQNNTFLAVKVSGEFIGDLIYTCDTPFPNCQTACAHLKFTEKENGVYSMQFWEIQQTSSTQFDTNFVSLPISFSVIANECRLVLID